LGSENRYHKELISNRVANAWNSIPNIVENKDSKWFKEKPRKPQRPCGPDGGRAGDKLEAGRKPDFCAVEFRSDIL
jgi:hypothetical protein